MKLDNVPLCETQMEIIVCDIAPISIKAITHSTGVEMICV